MFYKVALPGRSQQKALTLRLKRITKDGAHSLGERLDVLLFVRGVELSQCLGCTRHLPRVQFGYVAVVLIQEAPKNERCLKASHTDGEGHRRCNFLVLGFHQREGAGVEEKLEKNRYSLVSHGHHS